MAKEIKVMRLQCLLMPNGEIICNGKTLGWESELGKYLKEETKES